MSIVSNNIKYLRRLNGLTQEQFARRIGIKRSLLGAYEEARANPNLENLKMIAQVFGTSVDALIKTDIRKIRDTPGIAGMSSGGVNPYKTTVSPIDPEPSSIGTLIANTFPTSTSSVNPIQSFYQGSPTIAPIEPQTTIPTLPIQKVVEKYYRNENQVNLVSQRVVPKKYHSVDTEKQIVNSNTTSVPSPRLNVAPEPSKTPIVAGAIRYVTKQAAKEYAGNCQRADFVAALPSMTLPNITSNNCRAFESGDDFVLDNSIIVGNQIKDWSDIKDGQHYVIVSSQYGILYRRVYSQAKIKGTLLLSSDKTNISSKEVSLKDIQEIWECLAFVSYQMPEPQPSLERIKDLVDDLKTELGRI
ncbi:helix-turn-helix transcriptional regulator [Flectobacillus sp. DC10W]|jgi:DNA-binding XRE family transcriptional regulator|uniref:Helix-turn-helix transcriptional regulator n=1 Tax=Flectobacillus longus TaxID=2984207 RepID=A0ABT6YI58_9BACT|nr:helix-turn-helix transcriptional regulator [Flectobacillus longus]MDI9863264.1 helix-turn-helix transcriptional regulator [Flectobacillus longus]